MDVTAQIDDINPKLNVSRKQSQQASPSDSDVESIEVTGEKHVTA